MKNAKWWLGAPALLAVGILAGRALATGAPTQTPLTWAGVVTDQTGKPYPTAQDVTVAFWDAASGGNLLCKSAVTQAEGGTGRFAATLPGECVDAVHAHADVWSEATVGAGKTVLPRVHVGAVPYALEADSAKVASAAGGALKQQLDGLAAAGNGPQLVTVNADIGDTVTVSAPGGSALVAIQGQLMCKYTNHVDLLVDGLKVGSYAVNAAGTYLIQEYPVYVTLSGSILVSMTAGNHTLSFKVFDAAGNPKNKVNGACECRTGDNAVAPCSFQILTF